MTITASDWQQLSPTQGPTSPKPVTIVSANLIAPTTHLTILTGDTVVKTITPPVTHGHMLALQFAGTAGNDATGNILTAKATISGMCVLYIYNPITAKYVPVGDNA